MVCRYEFSVTKKQIKYYWIVNNHPALDLCLVLFAMSLVFRVPLEHAVPTYVMSLASNAERNSGDFQI